MKELEKIYRQRQDDTYVVRRFISPGKVALYLGLEALAREEVEKLRSEFMSRVSKLDDILATFEDLPFQLSPDGEYTFMTTLRDLRLSGVHGMDDLLKARLARFEQISNLACEQLDSERIPDTTVEETIETKDYNW